MLRRWILPWLVLAAAVAAQARDITVITVSGTGYERGLQHGKQLRTQIHQVIEHWKQSIREKCQKDPDFFIAEFMKRVGLAGTARQLTPDLLEEVRGIADGSGVPFNDIFCLQLYDELWPNGKAICQDRCSALGIRNAGATYVAQNMDLPGWLEGFQVVVRARYQSGLEVLLLTHAGMLALTGMNQAGVGVVVNALTQLQHSGKGLPVAFIIRGCLEQRSYRDALAFLRRVPHAAGQNYILGDANTIGSFEGSAGGVTEYVIPQAPSVLYHTNHVLASTDFLSSYNPQAKETNSVERLDSLRTRLSGPLSGNLVDVIMQALRAKDSAANPVCRRFRGPKSSFTFGSVIYELSAHPAAWVTAGSPDASEYTKFPLALATKAP